MPSSSVLTNVFSSCPAPHRTNKGCALVNIAVPRINILYCEAPMCTIKRGPKLQLHIRTPKRPTPKNLSCELRRISPANSEELLQRTPKNFSCALQRTSPANSEESLQQTPTLLRAPRISYLLRAPKNFRLSSSKSKFPGISNSLAFLQRISPHPSRCRQHHGSGTNSSILHHLWRPLSTIVYNNQHSSVVPTKETTSYRALL